MNSPTIRWSKWPWKTWLEGLLGFFYPNACQICGRETATRKDGYVGVACAKAVRLIQPPYCERCGLPFEGEINQPFECANCRDMNLHFSSARSAVAAKGVVLDVIHRYKYNRALWFEPFLASLLIQQAQPALLDRKWSMITPVPLHPTKEREREFNQAERLAYRLSQATHISLNRKVLIRTQPTGTQTRLSRHERAANVDSAFSVATSVSLKGHSVVLVDDVFTTGATTNACAKTLKQAGADRVCVWTVARGI